MEAKPARYVFAFLILTLLLTPLHSNAEFDSSITSASMCNLRNMGNGLARQGLLREYGTITNILSSNNIPVFCPIITSLYAENDYNVTVSILNPAPFTLQFSCILSQYDLLNFRTRSVKRTENVQSGYASSLNFFDLGVIPAGERLDLRCEVPPGGAYGAVLVF